MKRNVPLRSRRAPIKKKGRPAAEFARTYHSRERVRWVKSLPCVVTGERGPDVENVHVKNGGMGRKAGYEWIVPMTHRGHELLHRIGRLTFEEEHELDLELAAIATEQAWQAYQARNPEHVSSVVKRVMEEL